MIRFLTVLTFSFYGLAFAEFLGSLADRSPSVAQNLTVLDASVVSDEDRLALLDNRAVVNKSVVINYPASASIGTVLLVVQDSMSGKYGTTDGGIIVQIQEGQSLSAVASDYGMDIKHEFSALPMGVLMPSNINAAASYLSSLRADSRIVTADLDVNYYDNKPN